MADGMRPERFGVLLAVMVAVLLAVPALTEAGFRLLPAAIGIPALVVAAAFAVGGTSGLRAGTLVLAAATLVLDGLQVIVHSRVLTVLSQATYLGFLGMVFAEILRRVVRRGRVTGNTILAGICGYLMLGLLFHAAYALLEGLRPGSFQGVEFLAEGVAHSRHPELIYFSFVTLTTLGYGDVTPTHALAGMLATLEALAGQLYLAILIASLVGVALAEWQARRES
jgi:hypothetical protein